MEEGEEGEADSRLAKPLKTSGYDRTNAMAEVRAAAARGKVGHNTR